MVPADVPVSEHKFLLFHLLRDFTINSYQLLDPRVFKISLGRIKEVQVTLILQEY